eukprot:15609088-Heterocapsa_arctica.AAC.1
MDLAHPRAAAPSPLLGLCNGCLALEKLFLRLALLLGCRLDNELGDVKLELLMYLHLADHHVSDGEDAL